MTPAVVLVALLTALPPDPELGRRIYRDGVLPSGAPLAGTLQGDVPVAGADFGCAACHRRSGFGSSEGGAYVPPITAPVLFAERRLDRADLFRELYQEVQPRTVMARVRDPRARPAYDDASLAVAVREGRDPTGRRLDPLMPRYALDDDDMAHLVAYLHTLSAAPAPGVDAERIHFATAFDASADAEARRAVRAVMEAYVRRKNADTAGQLARPGFSPWHMDDFVGSFREWVLHEWQLEGPPSTWTEQLEAFYAERPVFAMLGGLGRQDWRPVHDFCERHEVPCLFPVTDLPVVDEEGAYALYFSRGLTLEAEALARHLGETPEDRVVQVWRGNGAVPARALREALGDTVVGGELDDGTRDLLVETRPTVLVLWLDDAGLRELTDLPSSVREVYLSASLVDEIPTAWGDPAWRGRVRLTYPYALPGHEEPRIYRLRAWMRSRGIARTHERLQLEAYFALSIADHALMHLVESFSRDFFVESVEHEAENALNPGVYPRLSLGPGQRFASKGCYVVRLAAEAPGGIEAVGGWIVP